MKNELSTFDSKIFDAIDTRIGNNGRNKRPLFIDDPQNAIHFVVSTLPPELQNERKISLCFHGRELFDFLPELKNEFDEGATLFPIEDVAVKIINYQKTAVEEFVSRAIRENKFNGFDHSVFLSRSANFLVSSCFQLVASKDTFVDLCNAVSGAGESSQSSNEFAETITFERFVEINKVSNRGVLSTPEKTGDRILQLFDLIRRPATEKTITTNVLFRIFDELECYSTYRTYDEASFFAREDLEMLNILCRHFIIQFYCTFDNGRKFTAPCLNVDFDVEDVKESYLKKS